MSEYAEAYADVEQVVSEYGSTIKILRNTEATVSRDKYGSIKNRGQTAIEIKAFPVRQNPSQKLLESLGIRETVDAVFYLSTKICVAKGVTLDDFDLIRGTVEWNGITYKLKAKNEYSQFNGVYLYIVLGGIRT